MFRKSLRVRFTIIFAITIAATMGICILVNNYFLKDYYNYIKRQDLIEAFTEMQSAIQVESDDTSEVLTDLLHSLSVSKSITGIVMKDDQTIICESGASMDNKEMVMKLMGYVFYSYRGVDMAESSSQPYNLVVNDFGRKESMEIWGYLDDDTLCFLSIPYENIQENVQISSEFFLFMGIFAVAIGALASFFLTGRMVKPITNISKLATKMADQDFSERCSVKGSDEIASLGNSMNDLADNLEKAINELQVANSQLQKDIEEKIQIDDMRREFLSNVAHELKTPIALIQGYAEGLKDGIMDDEESKDFYCEVIMDESAKMNKLVQKLMTLNQLEFGTDELNMAEFNLSELVNGLLNSEEMLFSKKDVHLQKNIADDLPVYADEFLIEEVLKNYVSNAMNHLDGERIVKVWSSEENGKIRISVFNTGHNIPEEDLEKIWIKFYKVDKARTRSYGGSGIGLSIVKAVMDDHHNKYGVYNEPDGVTFWFELDRLQEKNE